jgi:RNA methyltransferase, TrmH family
MAQPISKNTISSLLKLHQAKQRNEIRLFIAEGEKMVKELLNSSFKVKFVCCLSNFYDENSTALSEVFSYIVTEQELSKISLLQTPNQVLAVVEMPNAPDEKLDEKGIYLLLDGIRDPGNMGTIIRTAEWFGVRAIICSPDCVDVYNPKVVQGTMGSIFRMEILSMDLVKTISAFKEKGTDTIYGAVLNGEAMSAMKFVNETKVLVIGSEALGISAELLKLLPHLVSIPRSLQAETESLNAAVATGILLNAISGQ